LQFLDIARLYLRKLEFGRSEYWLNQALAYEELSPNARFSVSNDLANLYSETGREEEAKTLYDEIKVKAEQAPFTESQYFKTVGTTAENHHYRLVLALNVLPDEQSLPNNSFLEAIFEALEDSESFTITKVGSRKDTRLPSSLSHLPFRFTRPFLSFRVSSSLLLSF
jgi:hypothetical protein